VVQPLDCLSPLKSELKTSVLLSLLESGKKITELEKEIQTRGTTILHALKELEQIELTTKSSGVYKLTQLGIIEAQICKMCYLSCKTLDKHRDFWLTHDVSGIPSTLMTDIGALENSVLVTVTDVDLQKVHQNYLDLLSSSRTIFGVSPLFHPDYILAFGEILARGSSVDLIITRKVLEKLKQTNDEQMNKHISEGSLRIYLNDDLKFGLTVTEKCLSFGLFYPSGIYDYSSDLICDKEEGIDWGLQLFRKILENSTKM
jgi:predicted transcriptional regulator